MKIAGLASNRGRNLRHIADAAPGDAELSVVLTNREQAPVLEAATERRIPTEVVERETGSRARPTSDGSSTDSPITTSISSVWTGTCACSPTSSSTQPQRR